MFSRFWCLPLTGSCAAAVLLLAAIGANASELPKDYPVADPTIGESMSPTEIQDAGHLIATLRQQIRTQYQPGQARRDAHPKAHGCVQARFNVRPDIPAALAQGVFQPGASYPAVIRFSNGSPNATGDDHAGDTRGMAVKLLGVSGPKLFEDPAHPDAQDFIQISSPDFFINDSRGYAEFFRIVDSGRTLPLLKIPFILGMQGAKNAARMLSQTISNPLDVTYYSVTPYQLGEGGQREVVKYASRPCDQLPTARETHEGGPDFLRHAMQDRLDEADACFDFQVQPRTSPSFEIEDVITEWDQAEAPFVTVARLTIPKQRFDTAAQNATCENMSFNPWHSLEAHRPLGTVNRIRRVVYQSISELRHEMNGAAFE